MNKAHIYKIILIAIVIKVIYICFAFIMNSKTDKYSVSNNYESITNLFLRNDGYWYKKIHDKNYPKITNKRDLGWHKNEKFHQSSWGFMPGYPIVIKAFTWIFKTNFTTSALIVSIIFSLLSFILFYWLSVIWFNDGNLAYYTTLLFILMPFQYYFSVFYTEAIFSTLLIGSVLAVLKKNNIILALSCSLLVLLRANGIIMLIPIFIFILEKNGLITKLKFHKKLFSFKTIRLAFPFILPAITLTGYIYYQYINTGDAFAYSTAQKGGWYREFMFPLAGLFRGGNFVTQFNSIYAIVFMIIGIIGWKKFPLSYNLIIWINILLPLSAGSSPGMTRYMTVVFPFFFLFGYWLRNMKYKFLLLIIFFNLQLFMFYFWLISDVFSQ